MALDMELLKETLDGFYAEDGFEAEYDEAGRTTAVQLKKCLPALADHDLAAVAWFIAGLMSSVRTLHVHEAGEVTRDTAVAYTLTAGRYLGMIA